MATIEVGYVDVESRDDFLALRVRDTCRVAGCPETRFETGFFIQELRHWFRHGDAALEADQIQGGSSLEDRLFAWLDQLHTPLIETKRREEEHRKLNDQFPLRIVDPLIGG